MKTAVSVIVPCYNVAPYVDECMSGLAEQTLGPMEIICVDDGSTDGTLELLYRWREKDNRLRVISQSNAGVSAARNAGLDAAEGKYVGFVDPDDRVDRRMFSRLLGAAEKNDVQHAVVYRLDKGHECGRIGFCGLICSCNNERPAVNHFSVKCAGRHDVAKVSVRS